MTKDVIVSVCGLQFDSLETEAPDPVEVITVGEYYKKNNKHYVVFNEKMEGFEGTTSNTFKITDNSLDIMKQGVTNVHMVFEKDKKNITSYTTPYGNLMVGILAKEINVIEQEENIDVHIEYALEMNYEHLADCQIKINIKSKDAKDFTLESTM